MEKIHNTRNYTSLENISEKKINDIFKNKDKSKTKKKNININEKYELTNEEIKQIKLSIKHLSIEEPDNNTYHWALNRFNIKYYSASYSCADNKFGGRGTLIIKKIIILMMIQNSLINL